MGGLGGSEVGVREWEERGVGWRKWEKERER